MSESAQLAMGTAEPECRGANGATMKVLDHCLRHNLEHANGVPGSSEDGKHLLA